MTELFDDAREWARGRMWIPRALLLAYLSYAFVRFLYEPDSGTIFSGITLAFHEMGHLLFAWAPHFVMSLMGSGMQVLIPIVVIVIFRRQEDYFGVAVGGFWLSFSLFELARYVGDARAMELPLVGFSSEPEHDWHYLLGAMHMLPADHFFAFLIRLAAFVIGAASITFAVWLLNEMRKPKPVIRPSATISPLRGGRDYRPLRTAEREERARGADEGPSDAGRQWDELTKSE